MNLKNMKLKKWTGISEPDPRKCIDVEQVAVLAGQRVTAAWQAWESALHDENPARREWLAMLTAIDHAEQDIEAAQKCACQQCRAGRRQVADCRADAFVTAGALGLPRPPIDGRIPRYPVNIGAIRARAARLVASGSVWHLADRVFVVAGKRAAYYVHAAGTDPLEWRCSCPWGVPQPDASGRPGRGCTHVMAVYIALTGAAMAESQRAA